jgi:hypothetical protein
MVQQLKLNLKSARIKSRDRIKPYFDKETNTLIKHVTEEKHIDKSILSFLNVYTGKLTKKFFNLFLFELVRDYFSVGASYKNPDMRDLRDNLHPIYLAEESLEPQPGLPDEAIALNGS